MRVARLKHWRERRLLTQADLAQKSGVSEVTIARLETRRHQARFSTIRKLAEALGVSADELADEGEESAA